MCVIDLQNKVRRLKCVETCFRFLWAIRRGAGLPGVLLPPASWKGRTEAVSILGVWWGSRARCGCGCQSCSLLLNLRMARCPFSAGGLGPFWRLSFLLAFYFTRGVSSLGCKCSLQMESSILPVTFPASESNWLCRNGKRWE